MTRLFRAAAVIARRDYVATVWSRSFLLFLVVPLLPLLFGGLFGAIAAGGDGAAGPPPLAVAATPGERLLLEAARTHLARRLGEDWMPALATGPHPATALLSGPLDRPTLRGTRAEIAGLEGRVRLLLETARALRAGTPAAVPLHLLVAPAPARGGGNGRDIARGAQFALFIVTIILAGMLVSNLVEEKSNKVIEVLAAAVPVDAIFLGKLVGMLGVSLSAIAVWGAAGVAAGAIALPHGSLGTPALGWPLFVALAVLYWIMLYLLLGALYLGVGAQAGTVREVQTLSLPLTLGQLAFFGLASVAVTDPDRPLALVAAAVPWSSPFVMVARAAEQPMLWPHLLALAWQLAALLLVVRVASRLFRRTVLRSGPSPSRKNLARS